MQIDVETVERLNVKPGETLAVTLSRDLPADVMEKIQRRMAELVPTGVRVMLLPPGMKLQVISKEAA